VRRFIPQLCPQIFCVSLILFFACASHGQIPIGGRTNRQDVQNREWALANIRQNVSGPFAREKRASIITLRDDFRKLQLVNNELMKRKFLLATITPKEIRASLGEIKKVAQRLRANFNLPEVESQKNSGGSAYNVTLSPGLLLLDETVMRFVENPFFQQPKVLDTELASLAAKDLNEILRLTDFLRKLTKEDQPIR
jgi:hypothetical protein